MQSGTYYVTLCAFYNGLLQLALYTGFYRSFGKPISRTSRSAIESKLLVDVEGQKSFSMIIQDKDVSVGNPPGSAFFPYGLQK